jgi:M6 family metalloprotease-like protein
MLISHEIGHSWLYLEDLYSFGIQGPYENYLQTWDLMAAPVGPNLGFTSWTRWRAGWLDDDQVRCTTPTTTSLRFVNQLDYDSSGTKSLVFPLSDHSALVAEVRTGYGANADNSSVVVYEVDTSYEHGNGPIRLKGTLREVGDELAQSGIRLALDAIDISGALITVEGA